MGAIGAASLYQNLSPHDHGLGPGKQRMPDRSFRGKAADGEGD